MDSLFGLEKSHLESNEIKLLTTVYDNGSLSIVRSLLDSENIPYAIKERGTGSTMKIIMGLSMFGTDIYVPASCFEVALALVSPLEDDELEDNGVGMDFDNDYGADED